MRLARRSSALQRVEWEDPVTRLYVEQLFDHLTLGSKTESPHREGQLHPAPPVPRAWTAEELALRDRLVVFAAFAVSE
jgi:hypothetical protein